MLVPTEPSDRVNMNYITYNKIATICHFFSAIIMFCLYVDKPPLLIPYTETYLEWKSVDKNATCNIGSRNFETSQGYFCIESVNAPVYCDDEGNCYGADLGWLVILFHLLSFTFQGLAWLSDTCGPCFGYQYKYIISENHNPLRFIEYAFSASVMLIAIALLNGVTDINLIASIGVLNASCQLCGLAVEYIENYKIKWVVHLTGWLQFCCAYGIIGHAFFKSINSSSAGSGTGPPDFVYVIVIVIFILFSSFGFVQLLELSINLNPFVKEKIYVILSLTAKLFLGWMIFSNVLLLGNNE